MYENHVLLVEDSFITNLQLGESLKDSGFAVVSVYCGRTALAAIRRHPPWALITDLDLGTGPTGFDVARFARSVDPDMTVIYISGHVGDRYPREGVTPSCFIAKPLRGSQLVAALGGAFHDVAA